MATIQDIQDFLGLPAQAPANPVFSRTRRLSPFQQAVAVTEQADAVRAQRPFAALQQMENEYDAIAQRANALRQQQAAQAEAEQALSALGTLNPESPTYSTERLGLQRRFPTGAGDPRVQSILAATDSLYNSRLKRQQETQAANERALAYGVPVTEVEAAQGNPMRLAALMGDVKRTPRASATTAKDPAVSAAKDMYDVWQEQAKFESDNEGISPETAAALAESRKSYLGLLGGKLPKTAPPLTGIGIPSLESATQLPRSFGPAGVPLRPASQAVPIEVNDLEGVAYTDIPKALATKKAAQDEERQINEAWTSAKSDLQKRIEKIVPNKPFEGSNVNQLEAFARAIVNGETTTEISPSGEPVLFPVYYPVLGNLGLNPDDPAFEEPGNRRTGTQKVSNQQLLQNWAKDFLQSRAPQVQQAPTAPNVNTTSSGNTFKPVQ